VAPKAKTKQKMLCVLSITLNHKKAICNHATWEAEAGGLQVPGQPGVHSETVFSKTETKLFVKSFILDLQNYLNILPELNK
jgi:hypothetical protein